MQIKNNHLYLGGLRAVQLAEKYKTPLYVYDEGIIVKKYRCLAEYIRYPRLRIYYACKANSNLAIMKILKKEGAYIDAVSPGEIFLAFHAGFSPQRIMFTGNNVTDEEMQFAIKKGVMINIDSLPQLERYGGMNPNSSISVRINPGLGAGHHDHVLTGGPKSKFGIYYSQTDKIKKVAGKYSLKIKGVHMHIGSGILNVSPFLKAMKTLLKTAERFDSLEFVNIGGGIGIPYKEAERPMDMKDFGLKVGKLFSNWTKEYDEDLTLALEPGRYLVAEAGVLLTKVNTVKVTPYRTFVGVDTGLNHLIRPILYDAYHRIIVANKATEECTETVDVCGNICEAGDIFARDREMPKVEEGDLLAILDVGAYGYSMSSNYNSRLRPAEVLVSNGKAKIIRRRETFEDLLRGQIV